MRLSSLFSGGVLGQLGHDLVDLVLVAVEVGCHEGGHPCGLSHQPTAVAKALR